MDIPDAAESEFTGTADSRLAPFGRAKTADSPRPQVSLEWFPHHSIIYHTTKVPAIARKKQKPLYRVMYK